ncbi:uncharacterized protein B0H18DRAFT_966539 [Fomitopsis serialis]|uniref:uncharacterized protein n=1 Tax=Fomitopsis serialis TaxID=139415 RepID=UPI0020075CC9|nr:uncharacterized protein B0H18DRAFT_966539 [Neoantrodia serialis]KAH9938311.1 hypothetical protein B0H18DRAFT_966539 [Neoantrodia serialis]
MAPSPVRFLTPESLDQESWKLPSPALPNHSIPHEDTIYSNDPSFSQANADSVASFEQRVASAQMPPPGPDYFYAQRSLWWEPSVTPLQSHEASTSRRKLEDLLNQDDAAESDDTWRAGLGKVYRALTSGARLRKRLPLGMVVKILMSGWIRDGTWPRGGIAPDPDDELPPPPEDTGYMAPSYTTTPNVMSRAVSPWSPQDSIMGTPRDFWAR